MMTLAAERLVIESYRKLLSVKTRPFRVVEVTRTTITIDERGIRNTVSVGRCTGQQYPNGENDQPRTTGRRPTILTLNEKKSTHRTHDWKRGMSLIRFDNTPCYCIVRHVGKGDSTKYDAR